MSLIAKYETLKPVFDESKIREFANDVARLGMSELHEIAVDDFVAGLVLMQKRTMGDRDVFIEVIGSGAHGDTIATLYEAHPIFNSKADFVAARRELIETIADLVDGDAGNLVIKCPIRKRPALIRELGTGQLSDLMRGIVSVMRR